MFLSFLILSFLSFAFTSKIETTTHMPHTLYDDDDSIIPDNIHQLKSKFGDVGFQVNLFQNSSCQSSSYVVEANHNFNFPTECTCVNSNYFCFQELIRKPYFLKYTWNFSNHSVYPSNHSEASYLSRNISYCILNQSRSFNSDICFPCQDFYISTEALINRKLCWMIDIGFLLVVIALLGGMCFCLYGFHTYRHRNQNGYQRIPTTRYRFFTTN